MAGLDANTKLLVHANGSAGIKPALYLDGNGDYLSVADHADWDIGTGDFTVEAWVMFKTIKTSYQLDFGTYPNGISIGLTNTGSQLFFLINSTMLILAAHPFVVNRWYHIAATRNGSSARIFINGTQFGSTISNSESIAVTTGVKVGGDGVTANQAHEGWIREVRFSNNARYTTNFYAPTTPFTADASTILLLHLDEANGATAWTDSETTPKAVTRNGDAIQRCIDANNTVVSFPDSSASAHVVTAVADAMITSGIFNNTAGYFNGSTDYVSVPDHADWDFGTGDFTVEFWIRFNSVSGYQFALEVGSVTGTQKGVTIEFNNDTYISLYINLTEVMKLSYVYLANTWYHIAASRSGTSVYFFINGVPQSGVSTSSADITGSTEGVNIGRRADNNYFVNGWMKEVRISNSCRYSAVFNPSTTQFASDSNTKLLLHMDTPATIPINSCGAFDGTGDYLTVADHADWDFGTGDFTIEFWVRFNVFNSFNEIILLGTSGAGILIDFRAYMFRTYINGTNVGEPDPDPDFVINQWYHCAVCRSGTNVRYFRDGVQIGSTFTNSASIAISDTLKIGTAGSGPLNGYLKELRISNSARYTANFAPTQTPFVADSNTKLLLHMDAIPGTTTFTDSETTPKTITTVGDAKQLYISDYRERIFKDDSGTDTGVFGQAGYFNGSSAYITIPDHVDFNLTGDFTIDACVKLTTTASAYIICSNGGNGISTSQPGYILRVYSGNLDFWSLNASVAWERQMSKAWVPVVNQWYHIAVVRSGNSWYMFVDGTQIGTTDTDATVLTNAPVGDNFRVGTQRDGGYWWNGWVDELRLSNTARWTSNFTAPASPYTSDANTKLLLHLDGDVADSGNTGHTPINNGVSFKHLPRALGAVKINWISVFGTAAATFDGTGDYLSTPANADYAFGTGDFTVDFWLKWYTAGAADFMGNGYGSGWMFGYTTGSGGVIGFWRPGGADTFGTFNPTALLWYHLTISRSGTDLRCFVNGLQLGSTVTSSLNLTGANDLYLGRDFSEAIYVNGVMEEVRISKAARWTANFIPPLLEYSQDVFASGNKGFIGILE